MRLRCTDGVCICLRAVQWVRVLMPCEVTARCTTMALRLPERTVARMAGSA